MTVGELCELFDGCWSDLAVRLYLDGTEVFYEGGPEERPVSDGREPGHYELYLTTHPAPAEDGDPDQKETEQSAPSRRTS